MEQIAQKTAGENMLKFMYFNTYPLIIFFSTMMG